LFSVVEVHGGFDPMGVGEFGGIRGAAHTRFHDLDLGRLKLPKDMIGEDARSRTDSHSQPRHRFSPQVDQDGLKPVVSPGASGGSQAQFAKPKGSVIQDDQNFRLIDPMVASVICDRLAA
jgi:hypothetical protein